MTYYINESIFEEIKKTLIKPETGGILGIDKTKTVVKFYHDCTGKNIARRYIPDTGTLNKVIAAWFEMSIQFAGFVHSHRAGFTKLSPCDLRYSEKIKTYCGMTEILMLIYIPETKNFYQYVL